VILLVLFRQRQFTVVAISLLVGLGFLAIYLIRRAKHGRFLVEKRP